MSISDCAWGAVGKSRRRILCHSASRSSGVWPSRSGAIRRSVSATAELKPYSEKEMAPAMPSRPPLVNTLITVLVMNCSAMFHTQR